MKIDFAWKDPNRLLRQVHEELLRRGDEIRAVPEAAVRAGAFELLPLIKQALPKKTSTLARSATVRFERPEHGAFLARIGTHLPYAAYVEYGTGIFGPRQRLIVPVRAKALRWFAPVQVGMTGDGRAVYRSAKTRSGQTTVARKADIAAIFRTSVRGMKPRPVWREQTAKFLPRYVYLIQRELRREAGGR